MIAIDLINFDIPNLTGDEEALNALEFFHEYETKYLPVVKDDALLGIIDMETVLNAPGLDEKVVNLELKNKSIAVPEDTHLLDVIKNSVSESCYLVPVLDREQKYQGSIVLHESVALIEHLLSLDQEGGILEIEISHKDFSLSQFSRIIESEGKKILSFFTSNDDHETNTGRITIKINSTALRRVSKTLERFGYRITGEFYHDPEFSSPEEQDRFDLLLRYINI